VLAQKRFGLLQTPQPFCCAEARPWQLNTGCTE
jgi:hypothetical protein